MTWSTIEIAGKRADVVEYRVDHRLSIHVPASLERLKHPGLIEFLSADGPCLRDAIGKEDEPIARFERDLTLLVGAFIEDPGHGPSDGQSFT